MRRLGLVLALAATNAPAAANPPEPVDNPYALMRMLAPTLHANGYVARIDYEATCTPLSDGKWRPDDFSALTLRPPEAANQLQGLEALRARFADGHVALSLEGKVVVIRIGEPQTKLLSAKPSAIRLEPWAQFNADSAAYTIVTADELKATTRSLRMHVDDGPRYTVGLVQKPDPTIRHLPPILHDVTVAQALDEVATFFDGVVMFGTCKRPDGDYVYYADYECICEN